MEECSMKGSGQTQLALTAEKKKTIQQIQPSQHGKCCLLINGSKIQAIDLKLSNRPNILNHDAN